METVMHPAEDFGDNWSDSLERGDLAKLADYFRSRELVRDYLSFINFCVGKSKGPAGDPAAAAGPFVMPVDSRSGRLRYCTGAM